MESQKEGPNFARELSLSGPSEKLRIVCKNHAPWCSTIYENVETECFCIVKALTLIDQEFHVVAATETLHTL